MERALEGNATQTRSWNVERNFPPVPYDPAVPGSALLQQPPLLVEVLAPLILDSQEDGARILDSRMDVRRYLPGKRYVVEIDLLIRGREKSDVRTRRVIAKLYTQDQGANVFETLQELRSRGFAGGPRTLPQPLGYVPEWKLLVLSWAEGQTLRCLLVTETEAARAFDAGAQWLRKPHACGFYGGRQYT